LLKPNSGQGLQQCRAKGGNVGLFRGQPMPDNAMQTGLDRRPIPLRTGCTPAGPRAATNAAGSSADAVRGLPARQK
jgi:hypothetical protein